MLIENKPQKGDILTLKLISGDEIVAMLEQLSPQTVKLKKPFGVVFTGQGMAFVPFMVSAPDDLTFTLDLKDVLIYTKTRDEVKKAYIANTSSIMPANSLPNLQG